MYGTFRNRGSVGRRKNKIQRCPVRGHSDLPESWYVVIFYFYFISFFFWEGEVNWFVKYPRDTTGDGVIFLNKHTSDTTVYCKMFDCLIMHNL